MTTNHSLPLSLFPQHEYPPVTKVNFHQLQHALARAEPAWPLALNRASPASRPRPFTLLQLSFAGLARRSAAGFVNRVGSLLTLLSRLGPANA